jgi:hypothetical protein
MAVPGRGAVSYERGTPATRVLDLQEEQAREKEAGPDAAAGGGGRRQVMIRERHGPPWARPRR